MRARRLLFAMAIAVAAAIATRVATAHPAGFTSVNRYLGVGWSAPRRLHVAYLIDFAELPAYAEIDRLDADHDGTVTPEEQRAYLDLRLPPLVAAWTIRVDGAKVTPKVVGSGLQVLPGERGLETLRIAADVEAELPPGAAGLTSGAEVHVVALDPTFADRQGWREMAAEESPLAAVVSGATGQSRDALAYASAAGAPPRVDDGQFSFRGRTSGAAAAPVTRPQSMAAIDARVAEWSRALTRSSASASLSALGLILALALGAAHALSPGHGKALAAAYLVGRRAHAGHALAFGAAVTAAHTVVVFAVGCAALVLERTLGADRILRSLEVASAGTVLLLGIVQVSRRFREAASAGERGHDHAVPGPPDGTPGAWRSLVALGASAGLSPCPSALALLLAAIALRRYAFGLVLVLAFSLGVAVTLTGVGLLAVAARRRVIDRLETSTEWGWVLRWLPVVSSACVLLVGVLLCATAWSEP